MKKLIGLMVFGLLSLALWAGPTPTRVMDTEICSFQETQFYGLFDTVVAIRRVVQIDGKSEVFLALEVTNKDGRLTGQAIVLPGEIKESIEALVIMRAQYENDKSSSVLRITNKWNISDNVQIAYYCGTEYDKSWHFSAGDGDLRIGDRLDEFRDFLIKASEGVAAPEQ